MWVIWYSRNAYVGERNLRNANRKWCWGLVEMNYEESVFGDSGHTCYHCKKLLHFCSLFWRNHKDG
jgi:hypothetical protein